MSRTQWRCSHDVVVDVFDWVCVMSWQVAIAQFSDDARTEFKLNSYSDKERLLDAINKITYKGGNTKTGEAIGGGVFRQGPEPGDR